MTEKDLFFEHLAPTSTEPMGITMVKAEGAKMWDDRGKEYIDLGAGIAVCNTGHRHPKVINAIQEQVEKYLHIMVYGEFILTPQIEYATLLTDHLPKNLSSVFFTNSGTEAVEGSMKLAKRLTGRPEIMACNNSYHGSTQGALSLWGDEEHRKTFRPLLPGIRHIRYNNFEDLDFISENTACIILEVIQAASGIIEADEKWLTLLRKKCDQTGTLLIFDEIQTGFGRTGTLWAFEQFGVVPDILLLGKALGGGLPLGAFISSKENMSALAHDPILGHITTFGGNPVSCAAGKAALEATLEEKMMETLPEKNRLFKRLLKHPLIKAVRGRGFMMTMEYADFETMKKVHQKMVDHQPKAVFTNWFLFAENCMRIVPPLNLSIEGVKEASAIILDCCDEVMEEIEAKQTVDLEEVDKTN